MGRFEEYLSYCQQYEAIYGVDKTVVLYQCGKFYELYGVDNDEEKIGKVIEIANLLHIQDTRVNSKIVENSRKNPQMAGFNCVSLDRFLDILIENGYTTVIVDQLTQGTEIKRGVTAIWSQGTYINNLGKTDHCLVSLYIECEPHRKSGKSYEHIGMTAINLATGKNIVHEAVSTVSDPTHAMDDAFRFIQSFHTVEVLIQSRGYFNWCGSGESPNGTRAEYDGINFSDKLGLMHTTTHIKLDAVPAELYDMHYQENVLRRYFPDHGHCTVIEYLSLTKLQCATIAYILLLQFCCDHKAELLRYLKEPEQWDESKTLVLDYNAICQLNLNEEHYRVSGIKQKKVLHSVCTLMDSTTTNMGKRLLYSRLLNPLTDVDAIRKRYDYVAYIKDHTCTESESNSLIIKSKGIISPISSSTSASPSSWMTWLSNNLKRISDIERLHRRIQLGILIPSELSAIIESYVIIKYIINKINETPQCLLHELLSANIPDFTTLCQYIRKTINVDDAKKYTSMDFDDSFFLLGYHAEIDRVSGEIRYAERAITVITQKFSDLIKINSDAVKYNDSSSDESYHLDISKPRFKILSSALSSKISVYFEQDTYVFNGLNEFHVDDRNKSNVKFTHPIIDELHYGKAKNIHKIRSLVKEVYISFLNHISRTYTPIMDTIVDLIAQLDVYTSCAKVASYNGYCQPTIIANTEKSCFRVIGLRHPIIESLVRTQYVSHDLTLGMNVDGMLLYGINQTGKSSTMKAVGIAVVLAQAGFYVPAKEFAYYPYKRIMTRIIGNDNMHGGLSSFAVEMSELRSILIRADQSTLVLGDEICHGTETQSAISLVTASVMSLAQRHCTFIFATHLHQLSEMAEITALINVKAFHLTMSRNPVNGEIIYNRQLREGSGPATYGLEVAEALRIPMEVVEQAINIRKKYFGSGDKPVKSVYNAEVYQQTCRVCEEEGKPDIRATETHHIMFQSEADDKGFIGRSTIYKHHPTNLVPLCHKHHLWTHSNKDAELIIIGYKDDGHLDYRIRPKLRTLIPKVYGGIAPDSF